MPDSTFQSDILNHAVVYCIGKWATACKEAANDNAAFHAACDIFANGLAALNALFGAIPEGQASYARGQFRQKREENIANLTNRENWRQQLLKVAA